MASSCAPQAALLKKNNSHNMFRATTHFDDVFNEPIEWLDSKRLELQQLKILLQTHVINKLTAPSYCCIRFVEGEWRVFLKWDEGRGHPAVCVASLHQGFRICCNIDDMTLKTFDITDHARLVHYLLARFPNQFGTE